ncbi:hypothetical protein [Chroococcidiopsis sp.]|uniref:hypothetical protein n=1 Tax=Chroococcidiopsis sp. TaxID=3088168 RepID=UPI003F2A43B9
MQQLLDVTIPNNLDTAIFRLDRSELMRLQEMGIITGRAYIYLALKLTYSSLNISVDTESFCEDWQITESDLAVAIAQLHKKGALAPVNRQLELELF